MVSMKQCVPSVTFLAALQSTRRAQANQAGIDYVLKLRAEHGEPTTGLDPLTPSDELELVSFYAYKLAAKGVDLWPRKVIATAVAFLKRFYLDKSCIQHEVRKIAFACLYIAGKVCLMLQPERQISHLICKPGPPDMLACNKVPGGDAGGLQAS